MADSYLHWIGLNRSVNDWVIQSLTTNRWEIGDSDKGYKGYPLKLVSLFIKVDRYTDDSDDS